MRSRGGSSRIPNRASSSSIATGRLQAHQRPPRQSTSGYTASWTPSRRSGICTKWENLLLHHDSKRSAEREAIFAPLGSAAFSGVPDCLINLRRKAREAVLHVEGRGVEAKDYSLSFDFPTRMLCIAGEAGEVRKDRIQRAIMEILSEEGVALAPKEITELLAGYLDGDAPPGPSVRKLLGEMDGGEVIGEGNGRSRVYRLRSSLPP